MRLLLDIETTLDHSKIWCVVTKDLDTNEVKIWKEANDLSEYIKAASLIVAHNGIAFDFHLSDYIEESRRYVSSKSLTKPKSRGRTQPKQPRQVVRSTED
jgi:hypothetical protein